MISAIVVGFPTIGRSASPVTYSERRGSLHSVAQIADCQQTARTLRLTQLVVVGGAVPREEQLSDVLSEFARTMVTDFPIQGILDHLVQRIVEILPITGVNHDPIRQRVMTENDSTAVV